MNRSCALFALLVCLIIFPSTGFTEGGHDDHGEKVEDHGSHGGHEDHSAEKDEHGAINLDADQRKIGGITIAVAGPGEIRARLDLLGEVKLDKTRLVHVVPRVTGIATKVTRQAGDQVQAGELLAVVESSELGKAKIEYVSALLADELARLQLDRQSVITKNTETMLEVINARPSLAVLRKKLRALEVGADKGKLVEAYSRLTYAERNLNRERNLIRQKISSDQAFQEAGRDFEIAEAQFDAMEEAIRFNYRLEKVRAIQAVRIADNELHNTRRRLLLFGTSEEEILALSRTHLHEEHSEHNHQSQANIETTSRPPLEISDVDRHLAEVSLRSPIDGVVLQRHVSRGERVTTEEDAFLVGDLSTVWIDLAVYPQDLSKIRIGAAVAIRAPGTKEVATGTVAFVQPVLSEEVRTGFCRVVLKNPSGRWRPGLFVTGAVILEGGPAEIVVPRSAVIRQGKEQVMFLSEGSRFEPRKVVVGRKDATSVEILEGIDPGDSFAATGTFVLKAELARESLGESGHSH